MILNQYTETEIFAKFLNVATLPKGNISSPFTQDKKASFKVYANGSFKCNSSGLQGDVFQFVAYLNNLNCKTQFKEVLYLVANKMNLATDKSKLQNTTDFVATSKIDADSNKTTANKLQLAENDHLQQLKLQNCNKNETCLIADKSFKIAIISKQFTENDLTYWNNLGVSIAILQQYKVHSLQSFIMLNTKSNKPTIWKIYDYLAFAYEVNGNFEVYIPKQPDKNREKFLSNATSKNDIFGFEQIGKQIVTNLFICAGKKDCLVLNSRGFDAVTFRSETHNPKALQIDLLQSKCNNLFICYDNDAPGQNAQNSILVKFPNVKPILLPEAINDIADYFLLHEANDFEKIIENANLSTLKNCL